MVRFSLLIATLATVFNAQCKPVAQGVFGVLVDAVEGLNSTFTNTADPNSDGPVLESPANANATASTISATASATPTGLADFDRPRTLPDGSVVAANGTVLVHGICNYDARDPASWKESGAEAYLDMWLRNFGPDKWLYKMDLNNTGAASAIDCSGATGQACPIPEGADCNQYKPMEYFYVRTIASRTNEAFRYASAKLLSNTLSTSLNVSQITADFKLPPPPEKVNNKVLKNFAAGMSMADKVVKQFPGASRLGDFFGFLGGVLNIASNELGDPKAPDYDYDSLEKSVSVYLGTLFVRTEQLLHESLFTVFGETAANKQNDKERLKTIFGMMNKMRGGQINEDADQPIAEFFKGGLMMTPVQQSDISKGIDEGMKSLQHSLIGRYLASLEVYVETIEPYKNPGDLPKCDGKGAHMINEKCYFLKKNHEDRSTNGMPRPMLDNKYLDKLEQYGIDIKEMVHNIVDCNNGEPDKNEVVWNGKYPKCYFGMASATYADSWRLKWSTGLDKCTTPFRDAKKLPEWLSGPCLENEVPPQYPGCWIDAHHAPDPETVAGLDMRTVKFEASPGMDPGEFCGYFYDGRRCSGISRRECWFDAGENQWKVKGAAAKTLFGWKDFHNCMVNRFQDWRDDRDCKREDSKVKDYQSNAC